MNTQVSERLHRQHRDAIHLRRSRRYLRPTNLGRKSKKFCVVDIETGIIDNRGNIEYILSARPEHFIFAVVYDGEKYKTFYSVDELKKEFLKKFYKNRIVYAHNGEYDYSGIFGNIYYTDPSAIFNGKFISFTNGNAFFADSFNILPTSVKKLGTLLNLPKLDLGDNLKSHIKLLESKDIPYCRRDCEIVYKSLEKIFADVEPSYTIGAISLKDFRTNYLKHTIKVNPESDLFFDAAFGGRTEVFKLGECDGHVYDINSAYPDAMAFNVFPDPSKLRRLDFRVDNWDTINSIINSHIDGVKFEGMFKGTVYVPENLYIPPLPLRTDDALIFPTGTFSGAWCFPELRHAIKHGVKIVKCEYIVYAPAIDSPFKEFILDKYEKRNATDDEFERYIHKLYMNNLYGKLLQRNSEEWRYCKDVADAKKFMREKKITRGEFIDTTDGGFFLRYDSNKIYNHTIACWGAYVTAYVRVKLHTFLNENSRYALYCDTDSGIFSKKLNIPNSRKLGGWKLEDKKVINIRTLKDYVSVENDEEKETLKGVKKDAEALDPYSNVFVYQRMIKTRESLRRVDNLPPGTFIQQMKFITGAYNKRKVLKNGFTKPFNI